MMGSRLEWWDGGGRVDEAKSRVLSVFLTHPPDGGQELFVSLL